MNTVITTTTSHEAILALKQARLTKFSGKTLTKKTRRYEKAVSVYRQKHPAPVMVKVDSGKPSWMIEMPNVGSFTVRATSEEKARKVARELRGLARLPAGTKIQKIL